LPVSIRLDDLPEGVGELLRVGDLRGELRLVAGTATIEIFAVVDGGLLSNMPASAGPNAPNAQTIAAMREIERGDTIGPFKSVEDLLADLNAPGD
jgi:hypothetical protein